ncbi:hypothetical protein L6164_002251 [Bauhinia variegata]|uniref:Uncharacterized protein n=1 Tax=Bauhinia variegata TaxID=167791 RepID=A0ACB9PX29_BAUVA|nr:hypothetical protein L6164_002251 [Bauhinia variegata]
MSYVLSLILWRIFGVLLVFLADVYLIKQIHKKNNQVVHAYEYLDYPDQEVLRIKIFQRPPAGFCESRKRQLMVRPRFPTIYHESEKPDVSTISEVIVIVNNAWKVGDLVDWWTEGCYWSGRVTEILDDGKLKIDLLLPPFGEGPSSHEVSSEDLRPSLNWCLDNGWTVPTPLCTDTAFFLFVCSVGPSDFTLRNDFAGSYKGVSYATSPSKGGLGLGTAALEGGSRRCCAQIIMPVVNSVAGVVVNKNFADGAAKTVPRVSLISDSSQSTQNSEAPVGPPEISMKVKNHCNTDSNSMEFGIGDTSSGKTCSESSHVRETSTEMVVETAVNDGYDDNYTLKKMRSDKSICLNSMSSNTMEAAILDLEELKNNSFLLNELLFHGNKRLAPVWSLCNTGAKPREGPEERRTGVLL